MTELVGQSPPRPASHDGDAKYADALEQLGGLGISQPPSSPCSERISTRPDTSGTGSPKMSSKSFPDPGTITQPAFPNPRPSSTGRRPSLTPSFESASPSTPPRTHRNSPGSKSYFPLVASPAQASASPLSSRDVTPTSELPPPVPSTSASRTSIFPVVKSPSARPTPSSVFPLVKSPSANSARKMSANPFPFADAPLSPTLSSSSSSVQPPLAAAGGGRRPSIAPSTTSSTSDSTSTSGSVRPRQASASASSSSVARSPSSSVRRTPSITSTTYSTTTTSRSHYAPSIAPSAEGPTSIFATPVGYKPARSLAGLVFSKPSVIINKGGSGSSVAAQGTGGGGKKKFGAGLFSSSSSSSTTKERERERDRRGVTAPEHLVAGPERSRSSRVLDAALTTSQTWAIRRGEQLMAPTASSAAFASPNPAARGGGGTFAYRPGHQVRREMETEAVGRGVAPEELSRRLEVERDAAIFSNGGGATGPTSTFPTVCRADQE